AFSGPVVRATDLRGSPLRQAEAILAKLSNRNMPPERLLGAALGLAILLDEAPPNIARTTRYRHTSLGKMALRWSRIGFHRVWKLPDASGRMKVHAELHVRPVSRGRKLLHLGRLIEEQCTEAIARHCGPLL